MNTRRASSRTRSESVKTVKEKVSKAAANAKAVQTKASAQAASKKNAKPVRLATKKELASKKAETPAKKAQAKADTKTAAKAASTRSTSTRSKSAASTKDETKPTRSTTPKGKKAAKSAKESAKTKAPVKEAVKAKSSAKGKKVTKDTKAKAEPAHKTTKGKKETVKSVAKDDQKMDEEAPKTRGTRGKAVTKRSDSLNKKSEKNIGSKASKKLKKGEGEVDDAPAKTSTSKSLVKKASSFDIGNMEVKVDDHCYLKHTCNVLVKGKTIYDKKLNQSNLKHNNNKFYIIQLLQSHVNKSLYYTFNRWGRVGDVGDHAVKGPFSEAEAIKDYEKKLYDKSVKGDYTILDINYKKDETDQKQAELKSSVGKSKLHSSVANLMSLIFDLKMMNKQMEDIGYDTKKMPVGKLSIKAIEEGYEVLNKITETLQKKLSKPKLQDLLLNLSSEFYSLIPHDFGWKKMHNFILDTDQKVKEKLELLDSIKDIQIAHRLSDQSIPGNIVDSNYKKLKCDINHLEPTSKEYKIIEDYVQNTQEYSKLKIIDAFSLEREGEEDRYVKKWKGVGNRMLLWHGSRLTNFVGIISQGLRIAPPEAPCSGYRVGKGIYLADMIAKSYGYCFSYASGGEFCILLCEAAMGNVHELLHDNCQMHLQLPKDKHSVIAMGNTAPPKNSYVEIEKGVHVPLGKPESTGRHSSFMNNEYLCYNVEQVRIKYLLRMKA